LDSSNVEQPRPWDGDDGAYGAAHADRFEEGLAGYHDQFLAAAAIEVTATVLDIGCGNGQTTRDAARCAAGRVGTRSGSVLELARQLAEKEHVDPDRVRRLLTSAGFVDVRL
jgi:cyclopropane fatty-acyl-phospholipid synthase-like methyltransferase